MLNKIDKEIAFVQSALNLRARRQEMLASNLANADTPNYKARDLDFASALRSAMGAAGGLGGPLAMQRSHAGHLDGAGAGSSAAAGMKYRSAVQPSLDGNTVDLDVERAHFADNALHYQFLLDRAAAAFSTMKLAVGSER
ncbi:MAG: flagellar basal body rod protein FlgB [Thiobacillus sp.]|nr:flagellar basal body rod protein FlgB [Thiobacillus sp.]